MNPPIMYSCKKVKDKVNRDGSHHLEFIVEAMRGTYMPFEKSRLLRGFDKGQIKLKMTSVDYTKEHSRRKEIYKIYSSSKYLGHISKVFMREDRRAVGDVKGTSDLILFQFRIDDNVIEGLQIMILPNLKNSHPIINQFLDGQLDTWFNKKGASQL